MKAAGGTGVPSFSVMRKVTVGCWPGAAFETDTISAFRPFSCVDL